MFMIRVYNYSELRLVIRISSIIQLCPVFKYYSCKIGCHEVHAVKMSSSPVSKKGRVSREYDISELSQNFGKVMFETHLIVKIIFQKYVINTVVVTLFLTIMS